MLAFDRESFADVCRRHGVRRLAVFGSAVTDRFDPERSDLDFLVEFNSDIQHPFRAYFDLKEELESLFERPVDLVEAGAVTNPYVSASIQRSAEVLYSA